MARSFLQNRVIAKEYTTMILIKIWSIQRLKNIPIATFKNGSFLIKKIQHLYFTLFINTLIPNQLNIKIVIYLHSLKLKSCIKTDNAIFIEYLKKKRIGQIPEIISLSAQNLKLIFPTMQCQFTQDSRWRVMEIMIRFQKLSITED